MRPRKQQISDRQFLFVLMICVIISAIPAFFIYRMLRAPFEDSEKREIEREKEREKTEKYIASQPIVTRDARVVTKRLSVGRSSTAYYITFEFSDANRIEYKVTGVEYGLLAEGDKGKLSTQATEYRGFKRLIPPQR